MLENSLAEIAVHGGNPALHSVAMVQSAEVADLGMLFFSRKREAGQNC